MIPTVSSFVLATKSSALSTTQPVSLPVPTFTSSSSMVSIPGISIPGNVGVTGSVSVPIPHISRSVKRKEKYH